MCIQSNEIINAQLIRYQRSFYSAQSLNKYKVPVSEPYQQTGACATYFSMCPADIASRTAFLAFFFEAAAATFFFSAAGFRPCFSRAYDEG